MWSQSPWWAIVHGDTTEHLSTARAVTGNTSRVPVRRPPKACYIGLNVTANVFSWTKELHLTCLRWFLWRAPHKPNALNATFCSGKSSKLCTWPKTGGVGRKNLLKWGRDFSEFMENKVHGREGLAGAVVASIPWASLSLASTNYKCFHVLFHLIQITPQRWVLLL